MLRKWLLLLLLLPIGSHAQTCELKRPIVLAGFTWDSASFHNSVVRYILKHGFGCASEEISGATVPLFNGMARGDIDIAMEIWTQAVDKVWTDGIKAGIYQEIGTNLTDASQGVFVPKYLIEGNNAPAPNLKTVADLKNHAALFKDPEEPDKGRFYNCVIGWSCAAINSKKLLAYDLAEQFVDFTSGASNAITAAVESALRRHKAVVFYYWTPSWLIGKYRQDLVMLEEPPYDEKIFTQMQQQDHPTRATAYAPTVLKIGVRTPFIQQAPQTTAFLRRYRTSSALVSQMLAYMHSHDASADATAVHFLKTQPQIWQPWLDEKTAARVANSLR